MGFVLRRQVRDALPPGLLTLAERLVILEIADDANDETRRTMKGPDDLARRVDVTPEALRKHVQRIEAKGIPLRLAIGRDANGNPIYARSGRQTNYLIPPAKRIAAARQGGQSVQADGARMDNPSRLGWTDCPTKPAARMDRSSTPSPQKDSSKKPSSSSAIRDRIAAMTGCADDEIDPIIESIRTAATRPIRHLGAYLRSVSDGDLRAHLVTVRDATAATAGADWRVARAETRRRASGMPRCPHGVNGGWLPDRDGKVFICGDCMRSAATDPEAFATKVAAYGL
jgi:DNA-binding Lrp family transcriptional regulator